MKLIESCAGCKSIQVSDAYGNMHQCDMGWAIEETKEWVMHYERENMCWLVKSRPKDGKCPFKYSTRKQRIARRKELGINLDYSVCALEIDTPKSKDKK